jgi:hypothetical protein
MSRHSKHIHSSQTPHTCLNCGKRIQENFCSFCGQKTDTHRINLKHFFTHDVLHGVWHLDKGILFTIKAILTRPGKAAYDYINGKRINYYNVFYLILIFIGLNILLVNLQHQVNPADRLVTAGDAKNFYNFLVGHLKVFLFSIVPLSAFCSWLVFKKLKFNFAEHLIIGGFNLLGIFCFVLVFNSVLLLDVFIPLKGFVLVIQIISTVCIFLFPLWIHLNLSYSFYTKFQLTLRIISYYLLFLISIIITLFFIILLVNGGGDFEGEIHL